MHDPADLEATIERSFESRSARLETSDGDIGDVVTRVGLRRSRRRSLAVVGSLVAIGVGAIGIIALVDRQDPVPVASPGSEGAAVTFDQATPTQEAWRCHDQLGYWGEAGDEVYFASCEPTTIDGDIEVLDQPAPTTTWGEQPPATVPDSTVIIGTAPTIPDASVPAGDASFSPIEQLYTVVAGDSVALIADTFGVSIDVLVAYNEWPEGLQHPLFVGDEIRIPPGAMIPGEPGAEHSTTTTTTTTTTTIG